MLWPPNALLFAALLLAPTRWWWLLVLGALPAHLLAELQAKIPAQMVLGWFASNVSEALIGALIVRRFSSAGAGLADGAQRARVLHRRRDRGTPFLVPRLRPGAPGRLGQRRLLDAVASAPVHQHRRHVDLRSGGRDLRRVGADTGSAAGERRRLIEAALLLLGLLAVGAVVFGAGVDDSGSPPSLLYLPLPFLIWAALRFGPPLTSLSFAIVAFLVIWGAGHGHGPFSNATTHDGALPIQLFLITIGVPLMLLAALIEERRHAERLLRASQELFSTAFRAAPDAIAVIRRHDGTIIEANDHWLDMFGDGWRSAEGSVAPPQAHADDAGRKSVASLLRQSPDVRGLEMALLDRHGSVRQALVSITAVELSGEPCAIGIVHDISELRRVEDQASEQGRQLTHLTRVASLADFSSTLAHELNQPLTAILSNAQAALRFLARDPPDLTELRAILVEIADADKRAGLLIYHLRRLTKRGEEAFIATDLNGIAARRSGVRPRRVRVRRRRPRHPPGARSAAGERRPGSAAAAAAEPDHQCLRCDAGPERLAQKAQRRHLA